jgi:hypothetical protein
MSETEKVPSSQAPPSAVAGAALGVTIFAIVAVGLIGVSAYFAFVEKLPFTAPRVWAALIGAFYFGWRAAMMYVKYKGAASAK